MKTTSRLYYVRAILFSSQIHISLSLLVMPDVIFLLRRNADYNIVNKISALLDKKQMRVDSNTVGQVALLNL